MKQKITLRLDREIIRKAKLLAARQGTSLSELLTEQIESIATDDGTYETGRAEALKLLKRGFHMGGQIRSNRDKAHER